MEMANIMNIRTGGKPTISQKTALMLLDGLTEEQAEAEISRIEEEAKKEDERVESMFAKPSDLRPSLDEFQKLMENKEGEEEEGGDE